MGEQDQMTGILLLSHPDWANADKVHDWRNHVPEAVRAIWETFTPEQREALVSWAEELASAEEWD